MPTVAILGGSVVGSATALLFARAGWQVTVLDPEVGAMREFDGVVRRRPGAPQAAQAHGFPARTAYELRTRLPDVHDALLDAGANRHPFAPPPHLGSARTPADAELDTFRSRRVLLDAVVTTAAQHEPGVTVLPVVATGLVLEGGGVPRATGYGLAGGTVVAADLLVDAGGRRSPVTRWLAAAGIEQPEETSDCGLTYYSRHHRIVGEAPPMPVFALVHDFPGHQQLAFLGDHDVMTTALVRHADDPRRTEWRDPTAYDEALAANEEFTAWHRVLEPVSPVLPMGTVRNRMTALVADDRPLVLGLHQVGDSLTTTNPSRGRGISFGLAAASRLLDTVADGSTGPEVAALSLHAWQQGVLAHYWRETCVVDLETARRIRAHLTGGDPPATAPDVLLPAGHPVSSAEIAEAASRDADLFRLFIRALHMLDDDREIASTATTRRVRAVLDRTPA